MNQRLGGLKGIQKNIAYLGRVELKEVETLGEVFNQIITDKFNKQEEIELLKKRLLVLESEVKVLTADAKRIDGLRNEIVQFNFKNKNKIKKYIPF